MKKEEKKRENREKKEFEIVSPLFFLFLHLHRTLSSSLS